MRVSRGNAWVVRCVEDDDPLRILLADPGAKVVVYEALDGAQRAVHRFECERVLHTRASPEERRGERVRFARLERDHCEPRRVHPRLAQSVDDRRIERRCVTGRTRH